MCPLQIILITPDPARACAAVTIAAAQAAHDAPSGVHIDEAAVPVLASADVAQALDNARALGVVITVCPSGLADHGVMPPEFDDVDAIGLVALMGEIPDTTRLVVV